MKKLIGMMMVVTMMVIMTQMSFAQSSAQQTVTLQASAVYKMTVSGNPAGLTLSNGTAGVDTLTAVSDNSTNYSITQNFGNTVKITAGINTAIPAGFWLTLQLASVKGVTAGAVNISNAVASAVNVVTGINTGADKNQMITYVFDGLASAGTLGSTSRTVTLTLTN